MRAHDLDERWLPGLASRAQRVAARLSAAARRWTGADSTLGATVRHEPALSATVAAVAVAALLIAIVGVDDPTDGSSGDTTPSTSSFGSPAPPSLLSTIGPTPGTAVASYLTRASFDLRHFGEVAGARSGYAIVDLRGYETPAEAVSIFAGANVVRAYVRTPHPTLPTDVYPIPLEGGFGKLALGMQSDGRLAAATATTYNQLVAGLVPKSAQDRLLRKRYRQQALASAYEAGRLATPAACACVFAVLVRADVSRLAALARLAPVRAVDPALPTVTLDQLTVMPLRPDVTTLVPRPGLFGA